MGSAPAELLADLERQLGEVEARFLLAGTLGVPVPALFEPGRIVSARQRAKLERNLLERLRGVPLQYVLGEWEFYGRSFRVQPGVLIPRPETEVLVEALLERLHRGASGTALDLGTGTGVLAITLKLERPGLRVLAWDKSPTAARLARANAKRLGAEVEVRKVDFTRPPAEPAELALVVSNPPYIASREIPRLDPVVRDHEPHEALDGGPDGFALVRHVVQRFGPRLIPGGWLACEIGWDQGPAARRLGEKVGLGPVEVLPDLGRRDRVLVIRREK